MNMKELLLLSKGLYHQIFIKSPNNEHRAVVLVLRSTIERNGLVEEGCKGKIGFEVSLGG